MATELSIPGLLLGCFALIGVLSPAGLADSEADHRGRGEDDDYDQGDDGNARSANVSSRPAPLTPFTGATTAGCSLTPRGTTEATTATAIRRRDWNVRNAIGSTSSSDGTETDRGLAKQKAGGGK